MVAEGDNRNLAHTGYPKQNGRAEPLDQKETMVGVLVVF
jgi:hypothetical protein